METSFLILTIFFASGYSIENSNTTKNDQVDENSLSCVPGKVFTYDHNICYCNEKGTKITCKRKMYSTLAPELYRIQLQNLTILCDPGKHFKFPCKECVCDENGKYASCIRAKCTKEEASRETPDQCIPGSVFNKRCNACICGPEGVGACTKLDCKALIFGRAENTQIQCVPNSHLMFGCNDCDCTKDGKSMICNKMGCEPLFFNHEHLLNVTINCNASSTFNFDCHQCVCDSKGSYAMCSGMQCPHKYKLTKAENTKEKCNPGMIFGSDCNVCICNKTGRGVCTTFSCDTNYNFKYVEELNFANPEEVI